MRLTIRIALLAVLGSAVLTTAAQAGVIVWRSTTSRSIWEASDDGTSRHVIAHGSAPYISPDAKRLAYGNADNQLAVLPLNGPKGTVPRVVAGQWGGFATWSPDSRQLGAQVGTALVDIPSDGGTRVTLAHADHGWLTFSPGSTRVALDGYNDTTKKPALPLQIVPAAGGASKPLQKRATGATGICWSARNVIAFAVSVPGAPVFTDFITPGGTSQIGARSAFDTYPDGFSADGSRLLIEEDEPDGVHLGYVTMATGKITLMPGSYTFVQAISHDGTRALVTGSDAQGRFVSVVSLSDGRRLTTLRDAVDPSWTS